MAGIDLTKIKTHRSEKSPVSIADKVSSALTKDIHIFGNGLTDKKKEAFYLELSMLLNAGVDIKSALDLICNEQTSEKDKTLFMGIKDFVVAGGTISEAMCISGKFSNYEFYSVQIGEETGKISLVLKELAGFFHKKIKQKRQFISALTYPVVVLCTSFGMIVFMMTMIVPMFSGMFQRFGAELPWITKVVIKVSNIFTDYFYLLVLGLLAMVLLYITQKKNPVFRNYSSRIILRIPIIGEMVRKIYIARLCHFMTLLTSSKIPLLRSIDLIKQMIGFYPIESSLSQVEKDILKGIPLHKSMGAFPIYYSKMITLIKIGEEVNQLEFFFDKIAQQYADDVDHQSAIVKSLIEPAMILFLAIVVGTIVVAMYLPLFQLSTAF